MDGRGEMRGRRSRIFLALAAAAMALNLSACSATTVLNNLEPRWNVTATRDLAYAPGPRHDLDIYVPPQPRARTVRWWCVHLRRRLGYGREVPVPLRRFGAGVARLSCDHPELSHLSRGALPGLPAGFCAGGTMGQRPRRRLRRRSQPVVPDGPFGGGL